MAAPGVVFLRVCRVCTVLLKFCGEGVLLQISCFTILYGTLLPDNSAQVSADPQAKPPQECSSAQSCSPYLQHERDLPCSPCHKTQEVSILTEMQRFK